MRCDVEPHAAMSDTNDSYAVHTVPNYLTFLRLVLAIPLFVILAFAPESLSTAWYLIALGLFIIAAITDVIDGHVARKYGDESVLGRMLDPATDKILICGSFILLIAHINLAPWMVALIVLREIGVSALRGAAEKMGHKFSAIFTGKAKMLFESLTIVWALFYRALLTDYPAAETALTALIWLTVIAVVISGLQHVVRAVPIFTSEKDKPEKTAE